MPSSMRWLRSISNEQGLAIGTVGGEGLRLLLLEIFVETLGDAQVAAVDLLLSSADLAAGVGHDHAPGHEVGELLAARLLAHGELERGRAGHRLMVEDLRRRLILPRLGEQQQKFDHDLIPPVGRRFAIRSKAMAPIAIHITLSEAEGKYPIHQLV